MNKYVLTLIAVVMVGALMALSSCGAQEDTDAEPAAAQGRVETPAETVTPPAASTLDQKKEPVKDQLSVVTAKDLKEKRDDAATVSTPPADVEPPADEAPADVEPPADEAPAAGPNTASGTNAALIAAGDAKFRAGRDYTVLTPAQPTSSAPDKVELAEVFMYKCPHCFNFEPFIDRWRTQKPADVEFVRLPALFDQVARVHAAAYYAAEAMGVLDKVHIPFFTEIHVNRKMPTTEEQTADFVATLGVDKDDFVATMNSFAVDTKVRQADTLGRRYRISSVPTVVINGKYVTSGAMANSEGRLREIIDYLLAKELAER